MLNKEQIQGLTKGDKVLVHYFFVNPEHQIAQNNQRPHSRFNPVEHQREATVTQNGDLRLRLEYDNGKKLTVEKDGLNNQGHYGCDSIYYRRFSRLY